jgi:hypothetical protein
LSVDEDPTAAGPTGGAAYDCWSEAGEKEAPKFPCPAEEETAAKLLEPTPAGADEGTPYEGLGGAAEKEAPVFSGLGIKLLEAEAAGIAEGRAYEEL